MYPCPCCGYEVFGEPPGSYAVCPICFWEDDIVQLAFPDLEGGANACSLIDGQRSYAEAQVSEPRFTVHTRPPQNELRDSAWRPLDPLRDRYLKWGNHQDHELWQSVKNSSEICVYYWRPEYWLLRQDAT